MLTKSCNGTEKRLTMEVGTGTIKKRRKSGKINILKILIPRLKIIRPISTITRLSRAETATAPKKEIMYSMRPKMVISKPMLREVRYLLAVGFCDPELCKGVPVLLVTVCKAFFNSRRLIQTKYKEIRGTRIPWELFGSFIQL